MNNAKLLILQKKWERDFRQSRALQDEFGSLDCYLVYKKYTVQGRARIAASTAEVEPRSSGGGLPLDQDTELWAREQMWAKEFFTTPRLKDEFQEVGTYINFKRAEHQGRARVAGR